MMRQVGEGGEQGGRWLPKKFNVCVASQKKATLKIDISSWQAKARAGAVGRGVRLEAGVVGDP